MHSEHIFFRYQTYVEGNHTALLDGGHPCILSKNRGPISLFSRGPWVILHASHFTISTAHCQIQPSQERSHRVLSAPFWNTDIVAGSLWGAAFHWLFGIKFLSVRPWGPCNKELWHSCTVLPLQLPSALAPLTLCLTLGSLESGPLMQLNYPSMKPLLWPQRAAMGRSHTVAGPFTCQVMVIWLTGTWYLCWDLVSYNLPHQLYSQSQWNAMGAQLRRLCFSGYGLHSPNYLTSALCIYAQPFASWRAHCEKAQVVPRKFLLQKIFRFDEWLCYVAEFLTVVQKTPSTEI